MLKNRIRDTILEPKRRQLVASFKRIVSGNEPTYVFDYSKEKHYQIWFYHPFELNYIFIGEENFAVNASTKADEFQLLQYRQEYELKNPGNPEQNFISLLREIEFEFFSDCWSDLENQLSKKVRCFLIEYGIIRGLDVNNRINIDGEKIGDILNKEAIN